MTRLRLAVPSVLALLLIGLVAAPASAHVSVSSTDAKQGGYGELVFRMPTESETARSVKLQVALPTDTPLASVSVRPQPGWTAGTTLSKLPKPITTDDGTVTEAVTGITFTATDGGAKPGEFVEFAILAGPLPDTGSLALPATQTYSDGTVVRWDEPTGADGAEPEHPAPTLTLAASAGDASTGDANARNTKAADGTDALTVVALVLGALGFLAGSAALALVTRRRGATKPAAGTPSVPERVSR